MMGVQVASLTGHAAIHGRLLLLLVSQSLPGIGAASGRSTPACGLSAPVAIVQFPVFHMSCLLAWLCQGMLLPPKVQPSSVLVGPC